MANGFQLKLEVNLLFFESQVSHIRIVFSNSVKDYNGCIQSNIYSFLCFVHIYEGIYFPAGLENVSFSEHFLDYHALQHH